MIQPFDRARALGLVAVAMFLSGAALAQQPAQTAAKPTSVSTSAPTLSAGARASASPSASNSSSAPVPKTAASEANSNSPATSAPSSAKPAGAAEEEAAMLVEGEQRFATNCGRCHQAPHKFPPRMMATVVRHMRVRATITDEDMRLILRYMTQ